MRERVTSTGWVGFGLGPKMVGADAIVGFVNAAGEVVVNDYFITAKGTSSVLKPRDGGSTVVVMWRWRRRRWPGAEVGCKGVCADTSQGGTNDVLSANGSLVD